MQQPRHVELLNTLTQQAKNAVHAIKRSNTKLTCVYRMRAAFNMKHEASQQSGMTAKEAATLLSEGKQEDMMDAIYNKYIEYRKGHDLVIIEGLSGEEPGLGNVNEINAKIAATLETPVLLVMDSQTKNGYSSANDLANTVVSLNSPLAGTILLQLLSALWLLVVS